MELKLRVLKDGTNRVVVYDAGSGNEERSQVLRTGLSCDGYHFSENCGGTWDKKDYEIRTFTDQPKVVEKIVEVKVPMKLTAQEEQDMEVGRLLRAAHEDIKNLKASYAEDERSIQDRLRSELAAILGEV